MEAGSKRRIAAVLATLLGLGALAGFTVYLVTRPTTDELLPQKSDRKATGRKRLTSDTAPEVLGVVVPRESAELASRIGGRVIDVRVSLGDRVKKGQVLVKLDEGSLKQRIARARAAIARERSGAERATIELADAKDRSRRRDQLKGLVADEEINTAKTKAGLARADRGAASAGVALARAELQELAKSLEETEIVAPFDGVVAGIYASEGNLLQSGNPIIKINSMELWVRFAGPPEVMEQLDKGTTVALYDDATPFTEPGAQELAQKPLGNASVLNIAPEIDPASELIIAEAALETGLSAPLRVGTVVNVGINTPDAL